MDSVIRVVVIYLFLLIVFRLSGKRTLAEADTFDLLTLLIISETTQQAMVGHDHSIINAMILITTMVAMTIILSHLKQWLPFFGKLVDDVPLVIVKDGKAIKDRMNRSRVDEQDILEAARELRGLERMEQIKYAILERTGSISIIPFG
jgi:uncharacterized membrane protein YcaP (DUF421 family)